MYCYCDDLCKGVELWLYVQCMLEALYCLVIMLSICGALLYACRSLYGVGCDVYSYEGYVVLCVQWSCWVLMLCMVFVAAE